MNIMNIIEPKYTKSELNILSKYAIRRLAHNEGLPLPENLDIDLLKDTLLNIYENR